MPFELRDYQRAPADKLTKLLADPIGTAADFSDCGCHAKDTLVLLHSGEGIAVQDVQVGDRLMGPDSLPRTVLALKRGWSEAPLVNVVPDKGECFECNEDHLLTLIHRQARGLLTPDGVRDVSIKEYRQWSPEEKNAWELFHRNPYSYDIPRRYRSTFRLVKTFPGEYYGFTLAGDGRYCLFGRHGGLVTHNTGKTYVACEVIRRTDLPTLVVCPKVSIPMWRDVGAQVGVEFDVINWEKVRTGRTPYGRFERAGRGTRFMWAPEVRVLVFDEAHQACGLTSLNSKMVSAARMLRKKTLCITATPAESPLQMKALGYVLGLHNGIDFWSFAMRNGCSPGNFGGLHFTENKEKAAAVMARLSAQIEPRVVRVRIGDLGDQFPDVVYTSPLIELDEAEEVERLHQEAADAYRKIKECGLRGGSEDHPMTKMLRARQRIEILKLPGWVELGKNALSAGHTVFFFVNFKDTIAALHAKFPDFGIVDGESKNRNEVINAIQADRMRGCILNNEAGGVSISIHDITGKHPRYSIISPPVKAKSFRQVNFRTRRNGSLTTPHISVPVVAKTCEVKIKQRIDRRLDNNDILCDGELLYEP